MSQFLWVRMMTGRQKMVIAWTALILVNILIFAILEGYALSRPDPDGGITLSRYLWEAAKAWPPLVFLMGMVTGGLVVHLFWRWDPEDKTDRRG